MSGRIYIVDTKTNPMAPSLHKTVEPENIVNKTGLAYPHTSHCLASGDIMFLVLETRTEMPREMGFFSLTPNLMSKGRWEKPGHSPAFGYDYWYQPRHKTMISSSWGAPLALSKGFKPSTSLTVRFLHDPSKDTGYVGCALSSNMVRFFKNPEGSWSHEVAVYVNPLKVQDWIIPEMPGLITDFLISLDDPFLCFSNWLHGDIRQYNIEDPKNPVPTGQLFVGGVFFKGSSVVAVAEDSSTYQIETPEIKKGSHMLQIDVDTKKGALKMNQDFFVDFEMEPVGPSLAHEMRYPGGDCTSDIWV